MVFSVRLCSLVARPWMGSLTGLVPGSLYDDFTCVHKMGVDHRALSSSPRLQISISSEDEFASLSI